MKVYFLSAQTCALTVNGAYFGITDNFEKFAEVCLKDKLCVCFTPQNALPLCFFLTEDILFHPPDGCDVYLCGDAIAIYAHTFQARDTRLKIITQNHCENLVVTVFQQGEVQVTFQTLDNVVIAYLPPSFAVCDITFWKEFCIFRSPEYVYVYTKTGACVLQEKASSFNIENDLLQMLSPVSDALGFVAESEWEAQDNALTRTRYTLKQTRESYEQNGVKTAMLGYAFFESVRIGAEFAQMLSDEMQEKQKDLQSYLGDFLSVVFTDNPLVCGLVYKKAERLYRVRYFQIALQNEKITDVFPI